MLSGLTIVGAYHALFESVMPPQQVCLNASPPLSNVSPIFE